MSQSDSQSTLQRERQEAFARIVHQYSERLYWHIRHMVVSHADADDCLQNTFLKAWRSFESFRGESGVYTWLYRIATNECISFLKKRQDEGGFDPESLGRFLSGDPYFDGDAAQTALQRAISRLPPQQKAVFTLRYYEEMPYKDMTAVLGSSEGSLKASYHQAYLKVSQWVKEFMK